MIIFDLDTLADCEHRRHFVEIPDCPNYLAGSDGNIYSLKGSKGHLRKEPRMLKAFVSTNGYQVVGIFKDKTPKNHSVHRLICLAFHGPCPEGMECLHLDDNKKNNIPENLRWGTRSENLLQRERSKNGWKSGLKQGRQRFNVAQVLDIKKMLSEGVMGTEIAKKYNCHKSTIYEIKWGLKYRD